MGLKVLIDYNDKIFDFWENFEVNYGNIDDIDKQILIRQELEYKKLLKNDPNNIDLWIDYFSLIKS